LRQRAALLAATRRFFAERGVLEVDTPLAVAHAVTDVQLSSATVQLPGRRSALALHTSPEYAMKRLLAAGSGDIYQLCHVFRGDEQGPLHAPEFMMLEWYRGGFSMTQLMDEVESLLGVLRPRPAASVARRLGYREALQRYAGCDPLDDDAGRLADCAESLGFEASLVRRLDRDALLDLLMAARVGPQLGRDAPCFVHRYPASQAALARLDPDDPRVALRFELYVDGVELANGFEELADAGEQRRRFMADRARRAELGLAVPEPDERLLAALAYGLPACSGVALGFDRLQMLIAGAHELADVQSFRTGQA
jgi:lysyl-tRNA synthetase class 2